MKNKVYFGLDIGSRRLKAAAITYNRHHGFQLVAVHEIPAMALEGPSVRDLGELSESINSLLKHLSKKAGVKTKGIQLSISGHVVSPRYSSTIVPLLDRGTKVITAGDVRRINKQACLLGTKMEEEILHAFSQYYLIDNLTEAINPVGLHGRRLETRFLLAVINEEILKNFTKAVTLAGYEVEHVYFSTYAASHAVLDEKMKKEGCAVIDIGAGVTAILYLRDGVLKHFDILKVGGDYVTSAIAQSLAIPFEFAEDIKKSYVDVTESNSGEEEVLIKKEQLYKPVKRRVINEATQEPVRKMVEAIIEAMHNSPYYNQITHGTIVTGGSCLLPGLLEEIEKRLRIPVRLAKVKIEISRLSKPTIYAAAVGAAQLAANKRSAKILSPSHQLSFLQRFLERSKELYQEYF